MATGNSNRKKGEQLGMNPGTASYRLVKDLLFMLVVETGRNRCYRCGELMERRDFSIDHMRSWLNSGNARALFFDLSNITFSHRGCNCGDARPNSGPRIRPVPQHRLRALRISRGWSQTYLGDQVGVCVASISHYECGRQHPPADVRERIAEAFGVEESTLFSRVHREAEEQDVKDRRPA